MTLGQKLKGMRKKFGLSQEQLADILNVSRQAITKWETDRGTPDIGNLQELAKMFGVTVDYLLNTENQLPALSMRKELDRDKYQNKIFSYPAILQEYFAPPCEIYNLTRRKKMTKRERVLDFCAWGIHEEIDCLSDLSPYFFVKKENVKLLVNIKDWVLEVTELPSNINEKRFSCGGNTFINCGRLQFDK